MIPDPGNLLFRALLIAFITCLPVICANGQETSLEGVVTDNQDQPVSGAHVTMGETGFGDVTDSSGTFHFTGIPAGSYELTVTHVAFRVHRQDLKLEAGTERALSIILSARNYISPTVVVTATRTRRDLEEVPEPMTVIKKREIQRSGSMRLDQVLAEQTGLRMVSDHGTGVQLQGFDPEYTLIMLDGQPLIGRTAGTFDLSRVTVGNVSQIEMMKGPSSALWGSNAMAGVINIITEESSQPFEMGVTSRYGTNRTLDLGANLSWNRDGWRNNLSLNRNSSGGYRLVPGSVSQTVPAYRNYTGSYRTEVDLGGAFRLDLKGRYYYEKQTGTDRTGSTENPTFLDSRATQQDYSLTPALQIDAGSTADITLEHHGSGYHTRRTLTSREDGSRYDQEKFDQYYHKTEARSNFFWSSRHTSTAGAGVNWEGLTSERYQGTPTFRNLFLYGQHEWQPADKLEFIAGFRYDAHSEYTGQLSPKFSARYEVTDWLQFRASAGRGFKAPAFRQLFLDFTNPTVGYSVYGSTSVREQIRRLQEEGKIERLLMPLDRIEPITAERSWAYNAGADIDLTDRMRLRLNAFRNNVDDLIETAPVARKSNGQLAFSYFNLERIYTQGVEAQLRWDPLRSINLSLGYQLLDAQRRVKETLTVQDPQGNPIQRQVTRYEPMFNRSPHSATLRLNYQIESAGLEANLRGRWRSRYGRIDANGNGYVDPGEYEKGYAVWNSALTKTLTGQHRLQLGVDNLFDFTRPGDLPHLPGRIYYAQVSLQLP